MNRGKLLSLVQLTRGSFHPGLPYCYVIINADLLTIDKFYVIQQWQVLMRIICIQLQLICIPCFTLEIQVVLVFLY